MVFERIIIENVHDIFIFENVNLIGLFLFHWIIETTCLVHLCSHCVAITE